MAMVVHTIDSQELILEGQGPESGSASEDDLDMDDINHGSTVATAATVFTVATVAAVSSSAGARSAEKFKRHHHHGGHQRLHLHVHNKDFHTPPMGMQVYKAEVVKKHNELAAVRAELVETKGQLADAQDELADALDELEASGEQAEQGERVVILHKALGMVMTQQVKCMETVQEEQTARLNGLQQLLCQQQEQFNQKQQEQFNQKQMKRKERRMRAEPRTSFAELMPTDQFVASMAQVQKGMPKGMCYAAQMEYIAHEMTLMGL